MEKSRSAFVEDELPVLPVQNVFCTGTRKWLGLTKIHFLIGIKPLAGRLGASGTHHVLPILLVWACRSDHEKRATNNDGGTTRERWPQRKAGYTGT